MKDEQKTFEKKRAGFVGVVGLPNVGKSTLVNHITGAKVAITSNKPQTTRKNVMGVLTKEDKQYVFVDSPGFIQSENGLNSFLESEWRKVIEDVDVLIFVVSLDSKKESFLKTLDIIDTVNKKKFVVITKTDLDFPQREYLIEDALRKRGVKFYKSKRHGKLERLLISENLLEDVGEALPEAEEYFYEEEIYTTQTMRELSSEVILENIFRFLNEEVPYETGVQVREFKETPKIYKIYADVIVSRERYKKIIVGRGGETIKKIGTLSRESLEREFGKKIFLDLRVKCKEGWNKKPVVLKEMGYEARK